MARLMSVALTEDAVWERRKTVTRRLGWRFLKPGDRLTLCQKVQGRKPGEPLVRLADVEVVSVRREPLSAITDEDIARECVPLYDKRGNERFNETWVADGAPWSTRQPSDIAWITWYAEEMGIDPYDEVTRIEWRYLS